MFQLLSDEAEEFDGEFQEQATSQEQEDQEQESQDILEERIVDQQEEDEKGGILAADEGLSSLKGVEEETYTDGKSSIEISGRLDDDTSINLLLEDEDKMLDYEETDRIDMVNSRQLFEGTGLFVLGGMRCIFLLFHFKFYDRKCYLIC